MRKCSSGHAPHSCPAGELRGCRILGSMGRSSGARPSGSKPGERAADLRHGPGPGRAAGRGLAARPRRRRRPARSTHAHDFPSIVYFEAPGTLPIGHRAWRSPRATCSSSRPGEVIGPFDSARRARARGWAVSFTRRRARPGRARLVTRLARPSAAVPLRAGPRSGRCGWPCPPDDRADVDGAGRALERELRERRDGYREAALAQLMLLLVQVSRLAADVVGDLRVNQEPLLAEVFAVIERRYPEPLSLRDVAAGGEPLAGPPHHDGAAPDRPHRPGVDHRPADGGRPGGCSPGRTCRSGRSAGGSATPTRATSPGCSGRCTA